MKPAHYMVLKGNDIHTVEYWDKKFHAENGTLESYVEEVKATMADSVRAHKISDVKTGAFLSGGVDSSLVTALMKPEKSFRSASRNMKKCSTKPTTLGSFRHPRHRECPQVHLA